jgi:uncharacterized damage-inducible protein DinB
MLPAIQDLVQHKNYANAVLLSAIRGYEKAAGDNELRVLLHHILLANRFWLFLFLDRPFDVSSESRVPETLELLERLYRDTHAQEIEWIFGIREADLDRMVRTSFLPDRSFSIAQGLMQVCMHSHGHRAQCATRLRILGGQPPQMDFILWLKDRLVAEWPQTG